MKAYSKYIYPLMGLALVFTACSNEDLTPSADNGVAGKTYKVSLTVQRPSDATRTVLSEVADGTGAKLNSVWADSESLLILDKTTGTKVGTLTLESGGQTSLGVFTGEADVKEGTEYTVVYLGGSNGTNGAYARYDEVTKQLVKPLEGASEYEISGDFNDLCRADMLKKDGVKFNLVGKTAFAASNVNLEAQYAMAHFTVTYPSGFTADANTTLKVTLGANNVYTYKVTNLNTDIYLPLVADTYNPVFTLTKGDDTYTGSFAQAATIEAGKYYNDGAGDGSGIGVTLQKVEVAKLPELTGPVIEINGRKYRFVKGNLYCELDVNDKDLYTWHLYDKETYYQQLPGTSSLTKAGYYVRQINGTAKGSNNPGNVNANNKTIDLFPWGATFLGSGTNQAVRPDVIRTGNAGETEYSGNKFPSKNTDSGKINNLNIINLWEKYGFENTIYDFGYAYMMNGRQEGDNRTYVTPPLKAFEYICKNSFAQGCTIEKAGYNGEDAKGALLLFGITDLELARKAIQKVGGSADQLVKLDPNNNDSKFKFQITLPNYESLSKLEQIAEIDGTKVQIMAMFFACGGNAVYNFSGNRNSKNPQSIYSDINKTDGAYWSKDATQGDSKTATAYGFYFRDGDANEFCWEVGASGVKTGRNVQRSVRLMVDVTESEEGTVGPTM